MIDGEQLNVHYGIGCVQLRTLFFLPNDVSQTSSRKINDRLPHVNFATIILLNTNLYHQVLNILGTDPMRTAEKHIYTRG